MKSLHYELMDGYPLTHYYVKLFLRGRPDLHQRMKRLGTLHRKTPVHKEDKIPDFYELSKTSPLPEITYHRGGAAAEPSAQPAFTHPAMSHVYPQAIPTGHLGGPNFQFSPIRQVGGSGAATLPPPAAAATGVHLPMISGPSISPKPKPKKKTAATTTATTATTKSKKNTTTVTKPNEAATKSKNKGRRSISFDEMCRLMSIYGSTKCLRKRKASTSSSNNNNNNGQSTAEIISTKRKFYRWFPDLESRFTCNPTTGQYEPNIGHEAEIQYRLDMRKKDGQVLTKKRVKSRKERNTGVLNIDNDGDEVSSPLPPPLPPIQPQRPPHNKKRKKMEEISSESEDEKDVSKKKKAKTAKLKKNTTTVTKPKTAYNKRAIAELKAFHMKHKAAGTYSWEIMATEIQEAHL